jgi:hypothetical protein
MAVTHTSPPREALAQGLSQASAALQSLVSLAPGLGEQTTLTARYTLTVRSVAEVDGAAAEMGVKPAWTAPWTYQATLTEGTVTITVAFSVDPVTAPLNAATIEALCGQAAGNLSRGAA